MAKPRINIEKTGYRFRTHQSLVPGRPDMLVLQIHEKYEEAVDPGFASVYWVPNASWRDATAQDFLEFSSETLTEMLAIK